VYSLNIESLLNGMVILISLSGSDNGHICTLVSGGVLALHL
jgi:hypothetical protein